MVSAECCRCCLWISCSMNPREFWIWLDCHFSGGLGNIVQRTCWHLSNLDMPGIPLAVKNIHTGKIIINTSPWRPTFVTNRTFTYCVCMGQQSRITIKAKKNSTGVKTEFQYSYTQNNAKQRIHLSSIRSFQMSP